MCSNMPCNYVKKVHVFCNEDLGNAVLLMKDGEQSLSKVTQRTKIPWVTLSRWVNKKNSSQFGSEHSTAISAKTGALLVETIEYMGDLAIWSKLAQRNYFKIVQKLS